MVSPKACRGGQGGLGRGPPGGARGGLAWQQLVCGLPWVCHGAEDKAQKTWAPETSETWAPAASCVPPILPGAAPLLLLGVTLLRYFVQLIPLLLAFFAFPCHLPFSLFLLFSV